MIDDLIYNKIDDSEIAKIVISLTAL